MKQSFEKWLQYKHVEVFPTLLDDDIPDHFDNWLGELEIDTVIKYADEWMKEVLSIRSVK